MTAPNTSSGPGAGNVIGGVYFEVGLLVDSLKRGAAVARAAGGEIEAALNRPVGAAAALDAAILRSGNVTTETANRVRTAIAALAQAEASVSQRRQAATGQLDLLKQAHEQSRRAAEASTAAFTREASALSALSAQGAAKAAENQQQLSSSLDGLRTKVQSTFEALGKGFDEVPERIRSRMVSAVTTFQQSLAGLQTQLDAPGGAGNLRAIQRQQKELEQSADLVRVAFREEARVLKTLGGEEAAARLQSLTSAQSELTRTTIRAWQELKRQGQTLQQSGFADTSLLQAAQLKLRESTDVAVGALQRELVAIQALQAQGAAVGLAQVEAAQERLAASAQGAISVIEQQRTLLASMTGLPGVDEQIAQLDAFQTTLTSVLQTTQAGLEQQRAVAQSIDTAQTTSRANTEAATSALIRQLDTLRLLQTQGLSVELSQGQERFRLAVEATNASVAHEVEVLRLLKEQGAAPEVIIAGHRRLQEEIRRVITALQQELKAMELVQNVAGIDETTEDYKRQKFAVDQLIRSLEKQLLISTKLQSEAAPVPFGAGISRAARPPVEAVSTNRELVQQVDLLQRIRRDGVAAVTDVTAAERGLKKALDDVVVSQSRQMDAVLAMGGLSNTTVRKLIDDQTQLTGRTDTAAAAFLKELAAVEKLRQAGSAPEVLTAANERVRRSAGDVVDALVAEQQAMNRIEEAARRAAAETERQQNAAKAAAQSGGTPGLLSKQELEAAAAEIDRRMGALSDTSELTGRQIAERLISGIKAQFELKQADLKEAVARGLMTPEEAAIRGAANAKAYNDAVLSVISRESQGGGVIRGAKGREIFVALTDQLQALPPAAGRAGEALRRFRGPITSLTASLILSSGRGGPLAQLISHLLFLGVGGGATIAFLAGIALMVAGWRKFTENARKAREETKKAREETAQAFVAADPLTPLRQAAERLGKIDEAAFLAKKKVDELKAALDRLRTAGPEVPADLIPAGRAGVDPSGRQTQEVNLLDQLNAAEIERNRLTGERQTAEDLHRRSLNAELLRELDLLTGLRDLGEATSAQLQRRAALLTLLNDRSRDEKSTAEDRLQIQQGITSATAKEREEAERITKEKAEALEQATKELEQLKEQLAQETAAGTATLLDDARVQVEQLDKALRELIKNLPPELAAQAEQVGLSLQSGILARAQQAEQKRIADLRRELSELLTDVSNQFGNVEQSVARQLEGATAGLERRLQDTLRDVQDLEAELSRRQAAPAAGVSEESAAAIQDIQEQLRQAKEEAGKASAAVVKFRAEVAKFKEVTPFLTHFARQLANFTVADNVPALRNQQRAIFKLIEQINDELADAERQGPIAQARVDALLDLLTQAQAAFDQVNTRLDEIDDKTDRFLKNLSEAGQAAAVVARGMLGILQTAGQIDARTASILQNMINFGETIGPAAKEFQKLLAGKAFDITSLFGGVGTAIGLVGSVFGGDSAEEEQFKKSFAENTDAILELTQEIKGLTSSITGFEFTGVQQAINEVLAQTGAVTINRIDDRLRAALKEHGLTIKDLQKVAEELGIDIGDLGKLRPEILRQLVEAITASQLTRFRQDFAGQRQQAELSRRLGIEPKGPGAEFQQLLRTLAGLSPIFKQFGTEEARAAATTREGQDALRALLVDLFKRLQGEGPEVTAEELGGLSPADLLEALGALLDGMDALTEEFESKLSERFKKLQNTFAAFELDDPVEQIRRFFAAFKESLEETGQLDELGLRFTDVTTGAGRQAAIEILENVYRQITEEGKAFPGLTAEDVAFLLEGLRRAETEIRDERLRLLEEEAAALTGEARERRLAILREVEALKKSDASSAEVFRNLRDRLAELAPGLADALADLDIATAEGAQEAQQRLAELFKQLVDGTLGEGVEGAALPLGDLARLLLDLGQIAGLTGDTISGAIGQITQSLQEALSQLQAEFTIFDIEDPVQQLVRMQETISALSPALKELIGNLDLTTEAGRAAARKAIQGIFTQATQGILPENLGLTEDELQSVLVDFTESIKRAGEASSQSEIERQTAPASQQIVRQLAGITEVTGNTMIGYLASGNIYLREIALNTATLRAAGGGLQVPSLPRAALPGGLAGGTLFQLTVPINITSGSIADPRFRDSITRESAEAISEALARLAADQAKAAGDVTR